MPLPRPKSGESQSDFNSRCMADEIMVKEFPDAKQRLAVCISQWNSKEKSMNSEQAQKAAALLTAFATRSGMAAKDIDSLIDTWDTWAGSYTGCVDALSGKPGITDPEALCAWLHHEAEGVWPGEKSKGDIELTGMIVCKDEMKRIVFAPVLIPGEADSDGEVLDAEKIEEVAHFWLSEYGQIDHSHSLNPAAQPVESYISPKELSYEMPDGKMMVIPKGSWMVGAKVTNDRIWQGVLNGEFTGFSVMGVRAKEGTAALKAAETIGIEAAFKKTLLKDLGLDWFAPFISIVKSPAVPKSKWVAIKSRGGIWQELVSRFFKRSDTTKPKNSSVKEDIKMDEQEVKDLIKSSVKESTDALTEQIKALDEQVKKLISPSEKSEEEKAREKEEEEAKAKAEEEAKAKEAKTEDDKDKRIAELEKQVEADKAFREDLSKRFESLESASKSIPDEKVESDTANKEKISFPRDLYGRRIRSNI